MSPSRTHPTGLDRIIGIVFFLYPRDILWEFLSDGNGRSSDLRPPRISFYVNIKDAKLMASGLPEKLSVTMLLAAIRRLQQRDCPGFSPDSLLITTHSSCLRRQKVAANQLRVQRYYKKMNKRLFYLLFYSTCDKIIFLFRVQFILLRFPGVLLNHR